MEKIFRTGIFIFVLSLSLSLSKLSADSKLTFPEAEPEISMDFQDAGLKDILKVFSIQSGLNFIASEGVQDRKITLYLDKVPLKGAMDKLFKANNLSYELDTDSNIFIVKDWGKLQVETVTKVFYLKYATVSSSSLKEESKQITVTEGGGGGGSGGKWKIEDAAGLTQAVKALLSSAGSVIEDFRTNSLIVTDTPSRMNVIAQVIASLDVRVPQVLIDVEILDVSKDVVDKIGFEFSESPFTLILPGEFMRRGAKNYFGLVATRGAEGAVTLGRTYAQTLNFLRTQTDTKYLARPRLLTLNNETAEIAITKDEVMEAKPIMGTSTSGALTITGYDFKRATGLDLTKEGIGISLRVTPQINLETGEITMFIYPKSSSSTINTYITVGQVKDPEIRSTKSIVKVRDGETIVLGGLIHMDKNVVSKKLPILGDIPFLGALFRHKSQTKDIERELLVFITPHIIKDTTDIKLAQTKKVTLPEREQNTVSGVSRELEINASLNRFEKKKR